MVGSIHYDAQLLTGAIIKTTEIKNGNDFSISSEYTTPDTRFNNISQIIYKYDLQETKLKNEEKRVTEKTISDYLDNLKVDPNKRKLTLINRKCL